MPAYKKYRKTPALVEAVQWFRNGDHPMDESVPIDAPAGQGEGRLTEGKIVKFFTELNANTRFCEECGNHMSRHGVIYNIGGETETVHPGDYILTHAKGYFYRVAQKSFTEMFELYEPVELTELEGAVDFEDLKRRIEALEERFISDPKSISDVTIGYKPESTISDPGKPQS